MTRSRLSLSKSRLAAAAIAAAAVLGPSTPAHAVLTAYTDASLCATAVNQPVTTIDFDGLADGTPLARQFIGVSFDLFDGGNPLSTKGFKVWSPETAGAQFSAHPRRAPDGTVWSFGYASRSGQLIICDIAAAGVLKRHTMLNAPQADRGHDFAIIEGHLVFLPMPINLKQGAAPMGSLDRFEWTRDAPLIAWVVRKADFAVKRFELPNGRVVHIGHAWEVGGVLRLGYARYTRFIEHLHALDVTQPANTPEKLAHWAQVELNLAQGKPRQIDTPLAAVEFPSFDTRRRSSAGMLAVQGVDTVLALPGERTQQFQYRAGWLAEEHVFVPQVVAVTASTAAEGDGWVLGSFNTCRPARCPCRLCGCRCGRKTPSSRRVLCR